MTHKQRSGDRTHLSKIHENGHHKFLIHSSGKYQITEYEYQLGQEIQATKYCPLKNLQSFSAMKTFIRGELIMLCKSNTN